MTNLTTATRSDREVVRILSRKIELMSHVSALTTSLGVTNSIVNALNSVTFDVLEMVTGAMLVAMETQQTKVIVVHGPALVEKIIPTDAITPTDTRSRKGMIHKISKTQSRIMTGQLQECMTREDVSETKPGCMVV